MKLYWGPHTCGIGIHILLEEIGKPYETERLDVSGGATHAPPFLSINPKGKVPTLVRDDGSVLTEVGAIATWLARTNPEKNLLPSDPEIEARAAETIAYVEGSIHGKATRAYSNLRRLNPRTWCMERLDSGNLR
jgi:glutathione S-transferase